MAHPRAAKLRPDQARRWRSLLAPLLMAVMLSVAVPVFANHVQNTSTGGATYTVEFDHAGDNEWWVEFEARPSNGDSIFIGWARVEGSDTWHYMEFAANTFERQQQGWSKFQPDQNFQVPPGKRVQFKVGMTDGATGNSADVLSCFFTHPAGVEQCGPTSTTTTTTSSGFNPAFTGFRGNEWWVQANVGTASHCISKVDVRSDNGPWMPLKKQSWGQTAWAASYHFPQGSILQMRATSCTGQTDLSSCRQWIPASNTDARIVACPSGEPTNPGAFAPTFSNVAGNRYWQEVVVKSNWDLHRVFFTINCGTQEYNMNYRADWGKWYSNVQVPDGAKVVFAAEGYVPDGHAGTTNTRQDTSGYIWPQVTKTSGC